MISVPTQSTHPAHGASTPIIDRTIRRMRGRALTLAQYQLRVIEDSLTLSPLSAEHIERVRELGSIIARIEVA